jgi:hypothetical protein
MGRPGDALTLVAIFLIDSIPGVEEERSYWIVVDPGPDTENGTFGLKLDSDVLVDDSEAFTRWVIEEIRNHPREFEFVHGWRDPEAEDAEPEGSSGHSGSRECFAPNDRETL